MLVSDLNHFLDLSDATPAPARRLAQHLGNIVRAATAGDASDPWMSALPCRRRPAHRPCPGRITIVRHQPPTPIQWRCSVCTDEGVISNWEDSPYDLRRRRLTVVPRRPPVSGLADRVLPLIRTRADVYRWAIANDHGQRMHEALDILDAALPTADPAEAYSVTHKALGSAIKVIARADDSSGIIGDACRRLLELHPKVAAAANVPAAKLIDWMMTFQFDGDVDYFTLDPVAYAPALGEAGMIAYRARLMQIEAGLGQRPSPADRWTSGHSHEWFTLEWNARRLAVLDQDIDSIIRTHARDRRVAAWLQDTAVAFEEIGQTDLAIDWAKQATDFNDGHQSRRAADYWCELLDEHRPHESLHARLLVFRRWPSATTAAHLHAAADTSWPGYRAEVMTTLALHPRDAVMFALRTLKDVEFAWDLAHSLALADDPTWSELVKAYEKIDPLAVLPVLQRLVENELVAAKAQNYRLAARRLAKMRRLASDTDHAQAVDTLVAQLRETHRRRPRLQQEFDRAGLP